MLLVIYKMLKTNNWLIEYNCIFIKNYSNRFNRIGKYFFDNLLIFILHYNFETINYICKPNNKTKQKSLNSYLKI